ncbi:hypothetical protein [Tritonibacter mobilis]|uniref:hypothetical protein n=1 Tax=Tritonibacter mobilis TaxID=379347 RepID=UPI000A8CF3C5|nr:hypothetical protein [Tritonibacter mobilis]
MSNTQSWGPYARDILRRLRHAQTVVTNDLFDEAKQIAPVEDPPARNLLESLSELEGAQTRDSQELAELREAGTDGWAMDENGNDKPKQCIPADKILVCLQLAASFGRTGRKQRRRSFRSRPRSPASSRPLKTACTTPR